MLKKKELYDEIDRYLSSLQAYIKIQNKNGTFDINKYCEDFIGELLNIIYGLELNNLNSIQKNYPAIDLGDEKASICIQVTATNSSQKIKHTLDKFQKKKLYDKYNEINIFILGEKKNYNNSDFTFSEFDFDQDRNILDFSTLSVEIRNIRDNTKLSGIINLLKENLNTVDILNKRSILDNIDKIGVKKGKSYEKFVIEYFDMDTNSEEAIATQTDIEYLGEKLEKLNKSTREVIVGITNRVTCFRQYGSEGVYFNKHDLEKYLNISSIELYQEMRILMQKGFVKVTEETDGEYDELSYYDKGGNWEMISEIVKFCKKYNRDIKKIIVNLDFTEFD
jgi:hypothetical protein